MTWRHVLSLGEVALPWDPSYQVMVAGTPSIFFSAFQDGNRTSMSPTSFSCVVLGYSLQRGGLRTWKVEKNTLLSYGFTEIVGTPRGWVSVLEVTPVSDAGQWAGGASGRLLPAASGFSVLLFKTFGLDSARLASVFPSSWPYRGNSFPASTQEAVAT